MNGRKRFNIEQYIKQGIDKFISSEEYVRGITLGTIDANNMDCIIDYTNEDDIIYSAKIKLCSYKSGDFFYKSYFIEVLDINVDASFLYTDIDYDDCNFSNNHKYKVHVIADKYKDYSQEINITKLYQYDVKIDLSNYKYSTLFRVRESSFIIAHINNNIAKNISYKIRFPFYGSLDCIGWLYQNSIATNSIEYNMMNYRQEDLDIYTNLNELLEVLKNTSKGNNTFNLNINYGLIHLNRNKNIKIDNELCDLFKEFISVFDSVTLNIE